MAVSCVVTTSPGFKELLEKTHFSRGTLKSIIHEYQNTPSLWELGSQGEPSEKYVLNYFNRRTVGTPEQIAVWKGRYRAPHVYETYQDAIAASKVASQWFEDEDIMVYENDKHKWVVMIARPLDVFTIRKNSDAWLQDLQKDVDTTVNSGAVGRYIPDKRNKGKTAVAMDFLGKRLDNFYRQRGLKVRSKWSERNKKWLVEYAPEERGYVDDLTGGITDWTEGQKNAIDTLVNFLQNPGGGRYMLLEGAAGTGKTTLINEVLQRLEVTGKPTVLVGALSHKAKGVLGSKISKANRKKYTINAKSLAGMLGMKMTMKNINGSWQEVFEVDKHARRMGIPIQAASIVFIDEASMVSEEAMSYIEDLASAGTKIVFLGDQRQLPPIRTGGTEFWNQHPEFLVNPEADSPVFTRTDIPRVSLTERVRQGEDSPIHLVTDQFGNYTLQGGEFPNLSNVESSKDLRLVIENPATNLAEQMLPLFQEGMRIQNPNFAKIVAFTNAKVNQYNRELHFLLHPEMAASQDMNFAEGDLITMYDSFTYGNDTEPTVYNAEEGIVVSSSKTRHMSTTTGADIRYRDYTIKMQDDRTVTIPVLEQDAANIQNFNSALEQLKKEAINVGGRAWIPYFNLKGSMANMKMGYASTIHKSQGSTYQVVGVDTTDNFGSARFKSQGIYTALTRAANISILKGMGSTNAAPTAESISQANAREIARRQGMQIAGTPLSAEQIAFIKSEVTGVAKIIKDASVTITAMNLSKASPVTVKGVNDFKDGDTSTASAVCKSIINSPNATAQQKAYAKALLPLLAKMDFDILFATEENPIIQERLRKTRMEHWNAAGSTFNSKEAGLGYDIHIKVGVRKNQVIPEKVLLHEITHALTSNRLRNDAEFRRGIDQLSQYVQEWVRQNKDASQMLAQSYGGADIPFDIYGFRNYQDSGYADFVAEAMSNASFQELLKQIPAPRESELNTWQKLCKLVSDAFKKLFNISYKQNTTVYDMLIPVIADTMSLTSEQEQRDSPYTEWNIERTTQMMANATELVKAMNVAVEDKDVHWTTEQVMQLFGEPLPQDTGQQPTTQQGPIQSPSTGGNRTAVKKGDIIRITELSGSLFGAELSGRVFDAEIANISPRINGFSLEYIDPKDGLTRNIESDINGNPVGFSLKIYKEVTDTKGNPITLIETPVVEPTKKELFREALNRVLRSINYYEGQIDYVNNRIRYNQATSADYNWKEECEQSLRKEQEILQAAEAGKAEVYLNAHQVPELRIVLEKPAEKNIIVETVYELSPVETEKEGYSQGYIIKKKNTEGTPKQGAAQIQRMIDHDELPLGAHIMWQGLSAEELSELNKVKGLNKNTDGSWTVGYTEREVMLRKQNDTLLNSPLFGSHELHKLAALTMFKLSEVITQLQEGTVNIEDILMEESFDDDLRNTEFKGMDRIDIINAIGLDKLFKDVIREEVFNADINERLQEDFDLAEKAQVIYDNFDAFIRLGYQALIDLENISIDTEKAVDTGTDQKKGENGEDLTDEEVVALFGSTVEHWQVGFRQVSTFASLSNLIRKHLNRLYVLDKNGEKVLDEYGIERNIDSHEAVSKILKWTQGARNLEDMIIKLEGKIAQEPWVKQLTDVLRGDGNEQFKSQFYSNFKKYFQKYNIIYKEKQKDGSTVTKVKTINRDPFVINTMDMITSLDNSKHIGSFNLWNPRTNSIDTNALANVKQGAEALTKLIEARKSGNPITTQSNGSEIAEVEAALNALNIPMPSKELLIKTLDSVNVLQTLQGALSGLFETFMRAPSGKADYKFMNNKTQSNYRRIVEAFAPVMGDGLDSVSYEAGKLHYSYVTPSYLSKFVENMKGMRGDVRAFIESEYGNIEGWFRNKANNANQAGGEGWLNYILDRMMDTTEEARKTRAKFDHVVVLSDDSIAYAEKSPVQYAASMLSMYFYDDHRQSAYFRVPMMSNKQSEEYIKFDRIADNFKEVITDWLLDKTYAQELNRIRAVNFRNNAPAELERLRQKDNLTAEEQQRLNILEEYLKDGNPAKISSFDENGATFMFLEYLNDYVNDKNSELGKLLRKQINGEKFDETQNESTRFRELLREAIVNNLDARFDEFLRNLSREGFLQLSPSMEVIKVNALKDKLPQGKARGLLEEFFWNDMFMSINMMQLLCTDIAYYKNTEDLQKRFAQWHSPGLRGNTEATINGEKVTDGNTRSMTIADKIEKSDVVETLERVKKKVLSQVRFADNPAARDLMEAQIDKIIDAFKEVNVTDAQAYTSPTGYRKKMAIFGQWSERDEEVYQKILNGTFTAEDLDVLWQPLKPFVYSQITKNGYNPYIPTLKMGIQQKNSEYCLVLADALMRSVGEESTLTALFDFMEESHGLTKSGNHWIGTPHDHGIDTIMFNSAVKTGLMGVLDINSMSHDDIVKGLKKFAGVGQNEYDDRYVDTIPFEDYSIQQYNPAHLEGEQQLGSQNRVLVFADMPNEIDGVEQFIEINGEKVSVKQAKINYFKAIAENIAISEAGVRERFALDSPSRKIRNVALMRVLQEEIAKDARYGTDLQWACLLDESGNFNVPLSDAIQSDRIQQLLNSIIKNRINKQEISGGPVVQVSNYGTSKNLRIVRNADGTIKYYECYITAYDQQLYEDFGDGKGGIDMEKIQKANPKLLEMIGYRIPTEAKYSMAPLKIVGFLPRTAGEGIMLPKEITTLSGSDFDVDKMYIMRYRLNRTDNSAEFIKKEMEDYYLGNKMSGARVSREDSAAYRARVTGLVRGTIKPTTDTDHRIMSYWRQQREVKYEDFAEGRYHNDNLIIATQWGILTSGMAEDQVLASGNFDDVKQVGYMLAAMDNGVQYDTASTMSGKALKKAAYTNKYLQYADTQIQFHKQNMVAAKLIGVFAQANVSHAIVGMSDVEAKIQIPEGGGFSINGVNYKEGATFRVDEEYGLDNATRISTVLAQLLASSVDAVKDPVLNLLNINMDTVNIAVTLVRLGHDLEFIGLFLTHPIIKQLINRYNVEKASGNSNSLMQTLITMQNELMGEDRKGAALQLKYNYNKDFFVREHQLSDRQDAEYLQYRRNMDLTVLEIFKKLNNMAEMFRGVVHTTRYNSITSAVGPYASDTMNNRLKDEQFASNSYVTEDLKKAAEGIIYDENGNEVSIIQAFRDTSSELERELLGKNIIQANDEAYKVYSALKSRMGYMSARMAREFGRFYMSYYMNMESPLFDLSYENRKEMLDEFPNKFMAAKNQYRDNAFVQAVMMDQDKAGNNILALNTRGLTDTEIQALRSAWSDLYTSEREKGIEDKDNLALKLVEYNFFLGSFGFSPKTFMSLTPNTVKLAIPGYKESLLKELVMTPDRIDNLLMQFMLNLGYANLGTVQEEDLNWGSDDLLPIETFGDVNVSGLAKVQMKDGSTKWLYVEPIGNSSLAHAYFVDKLGGENQQCFEIDPSKKVYEMRSVVENAEPQSAPAPDPDSGESVAPLVEDNRPIYQRLMVLLTTYSMDDPKLNMLNLQDRFNKLYNAGQERYLSETTGIDLPTLAKIAEVLGVTPEELTKDVNDSENKLNLCK